MKKKLLFYQVDHQLKEFCKFSNKKKFFKIGYFGSLYKSRGMNLIRNLAKIDNATISTIYMVILIIK